MPENGKESVKKWTLIALVMNICLFILKIITGIFIMSIAIISEAIDSGVDVVASSVAQASAKKAALPPDEDHTYGHGKYENLGALIEAGLIIITATLIIFGAYYRLTHIIDLPLLDVGIIVLLISIVLKIIVSRKLKKLGSKYDSLVAKAESLNLGTDVYMTTTVLTVLLIVRVGESLDINNIEILDPLAAILVACFIYWAAIRIIKDCTGGLLDTQLPEDELKKIADIMDEHKDEYIEYHRLRTRMSGSTRMVDMHIIVSKNQTVEEAHKLVQHLEDEISSLFIDTNVLIHLDPCDGVCDVCKKKATT